MNILFITERLDLHSGWGRYATDLITALQKGGHTITVLCADINPDFPTITQYQVLPPALSSRRCYFLASWYAARAVRILKKNAIQSDVIHSIVEPYARIAQLISEKTNGPYVLTMHGSFAVRPFLSALYRPFATEAYTKAANIICVSHYTQEQVHKHLPAVPTIVIPNGVTLRDTIAVPFKNKAPLILSVGVFKDRKGYLELLHALPAVREHVKDVRLVIVGNQSNAAVVEKLQEYIREQQLEASVEFKQKISDDELMALYAQAKVFALTSTTTARSFEGFGLVYLEANAHGLPVIGSYGSGGEDAIRNGETGFLVHPEDSNEVAEKLVTVLNMSEKDYERMAHTSSEHARVFSWGTIVHDYEKVYMSL